MKRNVIDITAALLLMCGAGHAMGQVTASTTQSGNAAKHSPCRP